MAEENMSLPDYKTNDPKGWCGDPTRGAALGRYDVHKEDKEYDDKLSLQRMRLNNGGYDENGTYFGHGKPLYWCANDASTIDFMLRAPDRSTARQAVLQLYPKAKVRR